MYELYPLVKKTVHWVHAVTQTHNVTEYVTHTSICTSTVHPHLLCIVCSERMWRGGDTQVPKVMAPGVIQA